MKTHICMIVDRSGSMEKVREETQSGFNQFIKDQQKSLNGFKENKVGDKDFCTCKKCCGVTLTLIQFDDEINVNFSNRKIEDVTGIEYRPRGMTKLFDAIETGIVQTEKDISGRNIDKVLFVIMTDGQDNSSSIKLSEIAKYIRNCENQYKWQFVFIGTNMDAFTESKSINIPYNWTYSGSYVNTRDMWKDFSHGVTCYLSKVDKQVDKFFD